MFYSDWVKQGKCEFCGKEGLVDIDWVLENEDEIVMVYICDDCRKGGDEDKNNAE